MRVVCCQFDIAWEDKPASFDRVRALLDRHPPQPQSLLVLPEMFSTGFSMNLTATLEGESCPAQRFLAQVARQYSIHVVGGLVQRGPDGQARNQALLLAPDGSIGARYDKLHPFPLADEPRHHARGCELSLACVGPFRIALFICYDLRFPEVFRAAAQAGAHVMVIIANWPTSRAQHWTTLLGARAIENQAYVVGVNRCGRDPHQVYGGQSRVIDPQGRVMVDAGDGPGLIHAELDLPGLLAYRREYPFLADMHPGFMPARPQAD